MLTEELEFMRIRINQRYNKFLDNNHGLVPPSSTRLRTNIFYVALLEPAPPGIWVDNSVVANDEEEE